MKRIVFPLIAVALMAGAAHASGDRVIDPAKQDQIRQHLTQQGYDVRSIQSEDGLIEVYAVKNGQRLELYLDADLKIVRQKIDD
ncbi:PepSY domain-containing protein [Thalassococcus sp. CAU 1522]|uniref:PepSY domain-containing protein n=1 Tax=Thalassococcus arenae TaxID=2851652 RepID=A0ABS6NBI7_9RHOB|nr:PepSY domain-containing protein [Thalassococcus arenae]MBV2361037.1 PepSY domain-containing protein [Thalassococcus arenae]